MLVHLIYLVLVVGNNCIDAVSVLKPFILMLEKKKSVMLIVALGFHWTLTVSGIKGRLKALTAHLACLGTPCSKVLGGRSSGGAGLEVQELFSNWMRSELCMKWVPSHPTVSAFLLPERFNWFHGNLLTADLTSLLTVLYVLGTGNIFGTEKTKNMMKVVERKHDHKGLIILLEFVN